MLISVEKNNHSIIFSLNLEEDDHTHAPKLIMKETFYFKSENHNFLHIHSDRIALVAIINVLPFAGKRIYLNWDVSQKFLLAARVITRVTIEAKSSTNAPLLPTIGGTPALSFSGGADSMAALAVMPKDTEPVFMQRSTSKNIKSLYNPDAALKSCNILTNLGYNLHIVESDLEYLRNPLGFPSDLAVGSPIILLGQNCNFDSIAFGTILESAFGTSGESFRKYSDSSHYKFWNTLFESVGLSYSLPVAGVSEVGTEIILDNSALGNFYQSCIRGSWKEPCRLCWKCFRKGLLDKKSDSKTKETEILLMLEKSKEVRKKIINEPIIRHEGVLTYSLSGIISNDIRINNLKKLVRVNEIPIKWMEKWYQKSGNLISQLHREKVITNIANYLPNMSLIEIMDLENWNNIPNKNRDERLGELKSSIQVI